jgi:hypothetical protein
MSRAPRPSRRRLSTPSPSPPPCAEQVGVADRVRAA